MARRSSRRRRDTLESFVSPGAFTYQGPRPLPALVTDPFGVFPDDAIPDDERFFHPAPSQDRPARLRDGRQPRLRVYSPQRIIGSYPSHMVKHVNANRLVICIRRKIRKEVMHALKLRGRGSGGGRQRTERTKVRC